MIGTFVLRSYNHCCIEFYPSYFDGQAATVKAPSKFKWKIEVVVRKGTHGPEEYVISYLKLVIGHFGAQVFAKLKVS
jgi:hypothetical protein